MLHFQFAYQARIGFIILMTFERHSRTLASLTSGHENALCGLLIRCDIASTHGVELEYSTPMSPEIYSLFTNWDLWMPLTILVYPAFSMCMFVISIMFAECLP